MNDGVTQEKGEKESPGPVVAASDAEAVAHLMQCELPHPAWWLEAGRKRNINGASLVG